MGREGFVGRANGALVGRLAVLVVAFLVCLPLRTHGQQQPGLPRVVRDVEYVDRETGSLTADIYLPAGAGPFPSVLMVHGGAWMAGNKSHSAWHARRLAQRGFAVVAINYRLAPIHRFPAQLEDCQAALAWMTAQAGRFPFDVERIAAYGYSAGGHLVCLLAMQVAQQRQQPCQVRAVVAGGAPCEFRDLPPHSERLAFWLGGSREQVPEAYRLASPTAFVSPAAPPVFFFHGTTDRVVPPDRSRQLYEALRAAGVSTTMHLVAQAGHMGAFLDDQAFEQSVRFLEAKLRGNPGE